MITVISVLQSQTGMESAEVVRGNAAATHAAFPRVVVACKNLAPLYPGMKNPYQCILELTVQTESKNDLDGSLCETVADVVGAALQVPRCRCRMVHRWLTLLLPLAKLTSWNLR